jgi:hypothetical protein
MRHSPITVRRTPHVVCFGHLADIEARPPEVRFTPKADIAGDSLTVRPYAKTSHASTCGRKSCGAVGGGGKVKLSSVRLASHAPIASA